MKERTKNQRRVIKIHPQASSPKRWKKILVEFDNLSHQEQLDLVAQLAKIAADGYAEDQYDIQLMDQLRDEEKLARPWSEIRKELGVEAGRKRKRR